MFSQKGCFLGPRQYFYKDKKGITQKYVYCSLCLKGPFEQEDVGIKFKPIGSDHPSGYCMLCIKTLGLKNSPEPVSLVETEMEQLEPTVPIENTPVSIPAIKREVPVKSKKPEIILENRPLPNKEHIRYLEILQSELSGKKPIPTRGPYSIYFAQGVDGVFTTGVTTNLKKESKELNNGGAPRGGTRPYEIVYYRTEKKKDDAAYVKVILSKYKREQKERLIQVFENRFFAS